MKTFEIKAQEAIEKIKKNEKLALKLNEKGYFVAFSGGKDSQVLLQLFREAGVKYHAFMSLTTVDPPELIRFVRKHYQDVELIKPKKSIYQYAIEKKLLPTRLSRWCCNDMKEVQYYNTLTATGVRKEESVQRKKRNEIEISGHKFSGTTQDFYEEYNNIFEDSSIQCIKGKEKIILNPILDFTKQEVWSFIRDRNLPYCSLYDEGYDRIGCLCCPLAPFRKKIKDIKRYPHVYKKWIDAIGKIIEGRPEITGVWKNTPEEIFDWWMRLDSYSKWERQYQQQDAFNDKNRAERIKEFYENIIIKQTK